MLLLVLSPFDLNRARGRPADDEAGGGGGTATDRRRRTLNNEFGMHISYCSCAGRSAATVYSAVYSSERGGREESTSAEGGMIPDRPPLYIYVSSSRSSNQHRLPCRPHKTNAPRPSCLVCVLLLSPLLAVNLAKEVKYRGSSIVANKKEVPVLLHSCFCFILYILCKESSKILSLLWGMLPCLRLRLHVHSWKI